MATYNTIDEYETAIDDTIASTIEGWMGQVMKVTLQYAIQQNVYVVEEGSMYQRRGTEGGLADRNNIEVNYSPTDKQLTARNITKGTFNHSDTFLDDLVESGTGYDFPWGDKNGAMFPRPFYEEADKELQNSIDSMMGQGYADDLNNIL